MDFKITSIKKRRGFTLTELLVASASGAVMLAAVASLIFYTGRSFAAMANYVELDNYSRGALDKMSQQIRQTRGLKSYSTNSLVFEDYDGADLAFKYDSSARTLTRVKAGEADDEPLKECDELEFLIFQRNPVKGTYNQYPTATPETCKLVQLRWTCSRTVLGAKVNTESVQSAKIVIRKQ